MIFFDHFTCHTRFSLPSVVILYIFFEDHNGNKSFDFLCNPRFIVYRYPSTFRALLGHYLFGMDNL